MPLACNTHKSTRRLKEIVVTDCEIKGYVIQVIKDPHSRHPMNPNRVSPGGETPHRTRCNRPSGPAVVGEPVPGVLRIYSPRMLPTR